MILRSSLVLAAFITTSATAQTAPALSRATPDNPPSIPKVEGTPKDLYALRYIDTQVGTGEVAKPQQYYTVHYTGWLPDGTKFDSSHDHPGDEPIVFPYGARQVIAGWDTGFEGMHVGGKRRLYIPYQLAYGESGRPPVIPPKANLIFDVELVAQSDTPPEPKQPPAPEAEPQGSSPEKPQASDQPEGEKPATPSPTTAPGSGGRSSQHQPQ